MLNESELTFQDAVQNVFELYKVKQPRGATVLVSSLLSDFERTSLGGLIAGKRVRILHRGNINSSLLNPYLPNYYCLVRL